MNITVFGASGKVGRLVVADALKRGHTITAFCHSHNMAESPGLRVVQGDIHDASAVPEALRDADAVICALGSWGSRTKDIVSSGMRTIIPAMQTRGIKRIVSLTGAEARVSGDDISLLHRLTHAAFSLVSRGVVSDGEEHIRMLQQSALNWTTIRSPMMNNHGAARTFRLTTERCKPWQTIDRASVASAMLDEIENPRHMRAAPFIVRS